MRIRNKLTLLFLALSLIPIMIAASIFYISETNSLIKIEYDVLNSKIDLKTESISGFLDDAKNDVLFLSELSSLKSLINANSSEKRKIAEVNLQNDFRAFSSDKKIYYQIRYIDETGDEIVRIDSDGKSYDIIPKNRLQNKNDRYYFQESINNKHGEIFISQLDLNVENGVIENRGTIESPEYVPVIRYAVPVSDNKNNTRGIVITNVYGDNFLNNLESTSEGESTFLINIDGFYLFHRNKSKEWGFMFNNEETFEKDYGEDFSITNQDPANNKDQITFGEDETNIMIRTSIALNSEEQLTLIMISQKEILFRSVKDAGKNILLVSLIIMLIVVIISYYISKSFSGPILHLCSAAKKIGKGNMDTTIKIESNDEIGQLAASFKQMSKDLKISREKLEYSNKLKIMFIDIIRHDILNPVTVIKGYAEILSTKIKSKSKSFVESILEEVKLTEYIINSANEYAKVEDLRSIKKENLNLKKVVEDACNQVKPRYDKAKVKLQNKVRDNMPIKANTLINEVFLNLLTNALKYAHDGKLVEIYGVIKDKDYEISVMDYGSGVPDEYKKSIFTRLKRKEKKGVKGTGLGLAIVKKLTELHSGKVYVKDNPKGGAVFVVSIPKKQYQHTDVQ